MDLVTFDDIRAASAALPPEIVRTPLLASPDLSAAAGGEILLKCENLQVTGSYKARAAYTMLHRLTPEQRRRGAAISSSGNFAAAWAFMGRLLGIPVAVVMQQRTSPFKIERTRRYGAEIVICENDFDARWRTLEALQAERGMLAINTFEYPDVVAGHGALGIELLDQIREIDQMLIPVSSAGLIAGVATAVKEISPRTRVIGVQPEGSQAATLSYRAGRVERTPEVRTICDALIAAYPGSLPFAHMQRYVDGMEVVPEQAVKEAVRWLVEREKLVVEAGGAVAVAALLTGAVRASGRTVVLLSGGNIQPSTLAEYVTDTEPPAN